MPYIRVVYKNGKSDFDYVPSSRLETMLMEDEITHFYRPAEKRWVSTKFDLVRGNGGIYEGPERRGIVIKPDPELKKMKNENKQSANWLKGLWQEIGRS